MLAAIGIGILALRVAAEAPRLALWLWLGVEAIVIAVIAVRARRLVCRMRRDADRPIVIRLADALEDIGAPRWLARIMTTEVTTIGMALTGWFRRAPRDGFSAHRTHGTLAFHVVIALLIVPETVAVHLLVARATEVGAWIATATSIYALLWLVGDAHALRLGRIRVRRDELVIEIARRWAVVVPRDTIVAARREATVAEGALDLSLEAPTVALELSAPVTARGPFGITRTGAHLALTVDDPDGFLAALGR